VRRTAARSNLCLSLALAGLVPLTIWIPAAAASPARRQAISAAPVAIVSELHGSELYSADPQGKELRRLTNNPVGSRWPVLSPNGRRLAFSRKHASGWSVYVQDVGGGGLLDVTAAAGYGAAGSGLSGYPDWSPDGRKIAFSQELPNGSVQIIVYDLAQQTAANITNDDSVDLHPRWSPDGHTIVYASNGSGGNIDIYTVDADNAVITRLTTQPGWELDPTWSPDGRKIAYTAYPAGIADVFVMNADGSDAHDLTNDPRAVDYQPSWSAAGIAFASTRAGQQLYLIHPDGSHLRALTFGSSQNLDPRWSADGKRIVFSSTRNARSEIGLVTGTNYQPLTPGPWLDTDPAWSPNGNRLVFARSTRAGHSDIYTAAPNGRNQHDLTDGRGINWGPTVSPDGKTIAFVRFESFGAQIWTMAADGTHQRPLTSIGSWNDHPSWSPTGRQLVYTGQRNGSTDLYVVDLRSHKERRLTFTVVAEADPSWSPNGKWIAYSAPNPNLNFASIYRISPTGSTRTRVTTNNSNDSSPSWSAGSTRIFYDEEHFLGHDFDIYSTDINGTLKQPLATFPWSEHHAAARPRR
jgi:Tol biopolymer transport system component